ncbi:ABC transporter permease [uncultured Nocardioides sp.]|uniref:ABC transporter permease n=1 Tax=uncultured Nocardioides sp. TaxID=198441 RepID=UPI00260945C0|nr:ABC transporter permease [uncultured Nocardioides sp.]
MEALQNFITYVQNNSDYITEATLQHLRIVLIVIAFATVTSVLLGVWIQTRPMARALVLSTASIFLTLPALALFALFIPIMGIGNPPAMLALWMYALLPILRNTVTGLDSVPPAVTESARGMGLTGTQRLLKVKLPLALPVIMAGVRVATLLTVGLAAIAVLVGGDGLGIFIRSGLSRNGLPNAAEQVWTGTVFIVALGLLLDLVLATFQRVATPRGLKV